jgi:hypothetical protein
MLFYVIFFSSGVLWRLETLLPGMGCKVFAGCAASVLLLYSIYCCFTAALPRDAAPQGLAARCWLPRASPLVFLFFCIFFYVLFFIKCLAPRDAAPQGWVARCLRRWLPRASPLVLPALLCVSLPAGLVSSIEV